MSRQSLIKIKNGLHFIVLLCFSTHINATFSIIACDAQTQACGAAVATNNLAVGASVIYAKSGVGAVASQFETNPHYGLNGLALLESGQSAEFVIQDLLAHDNNFDGTGVEDRQLAVLSMKQGSAIHTGKHAKRAVWSGAIKSEQYSIQGNGLEGRKVLEAMEQAFSQTLGTLAEKLTAALVAGQAQGGQSTGSMSAALLVSTKQGYPHDINLRVDAADKPVQSLQTLLNFHYARQMIIIAERAEKQGESELAWQWLDRALERGARWDRIHRRAARLAIKLNNKSKALDYLATFQRLNPVWFVREIADPIYNSVKNT